LLRSAARLRHRFSINWLRSFRLDGRILVLQRKIWALGGAPTKSKELTGVLIFGVIGLTALQ